MPKENDLEGRQDMGGKHGGQAGMPKPERGPRAQRKSAGDDPEQQQPTDQEHAKSRTWIAIRGSPSIRPGGGYNDAGGLRTGSCLVGVRPSLKTKAR